MKEIKINPLYWEPPLNLIVGRDLTISNIASDLITSDRQDVRIKIEWA